jgi:hypothetical protein
MSSPPTPKQPQPEKLKDWYPYYAGFTSDFVDAVLSTYFEASCYLLDPWNGSGTTTAVAAARGRSCVGIDINPAVTVVARARLTPCSVRDSLGPLANEIALAARRESPLQRRNDPLSRWFRRPAVESIRRLQHAIHAVLVGDADLEVELARYHGRSPDALPLLGAFYYTALFAAVRALLAPFRASNPSWLTYPSTLNHRISPSQDRITAAFHDRADHLANRLTVPTEYAHSGATILLGSALDLPDQQVYDGCFTSPPYATRIDYVRGTSAELAILGLDDDQIADLRRNTTGTPTVRGIIKPRCALLSDAANKTISAVESHTSHGSSNYYGPWIRNYLTDLETSLSKISASVKPSGVIGIVVQDSYYKSIHVDLQRIVCETIEALGRRLAARHDYPVRHSLAKKNPAARKHLSTRVNHESLLVFAP